MLCRSVKMSVAFARMHVYVCVRGLACRSKKHIAKNDVCLKWSNEPQLKCKSAKYFFKFLWDANDFHKMSSKCSSKINEIYWLPLQKNNMFIKDQQHWMIFIENLRKLIGTNGQLAFRIGQLTIKLLNDIPPDLPPCLPPEIWLINISANKFIQI